MTATQKNAVRSALSLFAAQAGITFIEVPGDSTTRGDIVFGMVGNIDWASAFAYLPEDGMDRSPTSLSGEVWFSELDVGNMAVGDWGYWVAIHEIGHAIGFKHPFEGDPVLAQSVDNTDFTVMSYTVTSIPTTLRNYDVNAAETLYGSRSAANANGITGAWDASVQLVRITGSAASEVILGTGWHDTISAGGGNDTVYAGSGNDIVTAGDGNDTVHGGYGNDTIDGGIGNDTLLGGIGNDTLTGGAGADNLDGGTGDDVYLLTADSGDTVTASDAPGTARNTANFSGAVGGVQITLTASGGSAVLRSGGVGVVADNLVGAFDVVVATAAADVINASTAPRGVEVIGAAGADTITGSSADDSIRGGSGDDVLNGGGGTADVALFTRPRWEYSITGSIGSATLAGLTAAALTADGTDSLSNVEFLDFAGTRVSVATALANALPTATATGVGAASQTRRPITDFFSASDANGQTVGGYVFTDLTQGGGRLIRILGPFYPEFEITQTIGVPLSEIYYEGGPAGTVDTIRVELNDGLESSFPEFTIATTRANFAPTITSLNATLQGETATPLTSLFSVSDADGDPITRYRFQSLGGSLMSGRIEVDGQVKAPSEIFEATPAQLATALVTAIDSASPYTIFMQANDGTGWTPWQFVNFNVVASSNAAPRFSGNAQTAGLGQLRELSAFVTAVDPEGDAIQRYRVTDLEAGGAQIEIAGTPLAANVRRELTPAEFAAAMLRGGSSSGTNVFGFEAYDGIRWGYTSITIGTNGFRPVVTPTGANVAVNSATPLTSLFTVTDVDGGDWLIFDVIDPAGGGSIRVGGVVQASGTPIFLTPATFATAEYVAGSAPNSEILLVRGYDGAGGSPSTPVPVTTIGAALPAEIAVSGGGLSIVDGDATPAATDGTDFGAATQGAAAVQKTFTITNTGGSTLTTSSLVLPTGFTLVEGLSASIAAGGSDTFTVQLDTAVVGTKSGQISFATNDSDENPFNFSITGVVNPTPAEIAVSGLGVNIVDGDTTPSATDATDFGAATQGAAAVQRTYTVTNSGGSALTTSGLVLPTGFTLVEGLSASIAAGGTDTFTVQLDTSVVGAKSGQISFTTSDADENPFNFSITGVVNAVVTPAEIAVSGGGIDIVDGDTTP
ncbi:MAG: choice-of-anchor D domain-containing protein, partial [Alphaproteobacteria bacterium]|nr:choice-of-anchor D domain-containing protein [Alphaproteobacteria bacterium]